MSQARFPRGLAAKNALEVPVTRGRACWTAMGASWRVHRPSLALSPSDRVAIVGCFVGGRCDVKMDPHEISPELVLVDPELAALARLQLPEPGSFWASNAPSPPTA